MFYKNKGPNIDGQRKEVRITTTAIRFILSLCTPAASQELQKSISEISVHPLSVPFNRHFNVTLITNPLYALPTHCRIDRAKKSVNLIQLICLRFGIVVYIIRSHTYLWGDDLKG